LHIIFRYAYINFTQLWPSENINKWRIFTQLHHVWSESKYSKRFSAKWKVPMVRNDFINKKVIQNLKTQLCDKKTFIWKEGKHCLFYKEYILISTRYQLHRPLQQRSALVAKRTYTVNKRRRITKKKSPAAVINSL
jgi:hypothetical protein